MIDAKQTILNFPWRDFLARLPLPMLAFSASYGVYSYALLYVPDWVAVAQAAAFELTYIGLAVTRSLNEGQRRRATAISIGAVVVSVLYNSLAGLFHRQPEVLHHLGSTAEIILAVLHGAPLAWVAYLVSDLLLHSHTETVKPGQIETVIPTETTESKQPEVETSDEMSPITELLETFALPEVKPEAVTRNVVTEDWQARAKKLKAENPGLSGRAIAAIVQKSPTAVNALFKPAQQEAVS